MLNVKLAKRGTEAELRLDGRIDSNSAPELEKILLDAAGRFDTVSLDFEKVPYISSAGFRALRMLQRAMKEKKATVTIRNVRPDVMDIFNVTGTVTFFDFE